ncbi:MAG: dihydrofolate reductase family protein, partial [Muribaculaceae bacterium]|nr:dihydrofolate reductase family protein [Muribaculaceae bacterium]
RDPIIIDSHAGVSDILAQLYAFGITSLLVEGGPTVLQSFIDSGLWDVARVETSSVSFGAKGSAPAPRFSAIPYKTFPLDHSLVTLYSNNPLIK